MVLVGASETADGAGAAIVWFAGVGLAGGDGTTEFVSATLLVCPEGTAFVGVEGAGGGGQLVITFVPTMINGGPVCTGSTTGAGAVSFVAVLTGTVGGGGAGNGGNSGKFTMPGGKFIVATGVLAQLRPQYENKRLPRPFLLGLPLLENLVDAGVVGRPVDFILAVAKNQHGQPPGIPDHLVQFRLQRAEAGVGWRNVALLTNLLMPDAIVTASSGLQRCSGNWPVRNSWSNVHTPMLSPARKWPPRLVDNNWFTSAFTAGNRLFMSAEVSKMNRKRLSMICAAGLRAPRRHAKESRAQRKCDHRAVGK